MSHHGKCNNNAREEKKEEGIKNNVPVCLSILTYVSFYIFFIMYVLCILYIFLYDMVIYASRRVYHGSLIA